MRAFRDRSRRIVAGLGLGLLISIGAGGPSAHAQPANTLLYGVTPSNRLIAFASTAPGQLLTSVPDHEPRAW
jgi:hypothetical protein